MESIFAPLSDEEERIGNLVVRSAIIVHRNLGPGLLEKIYESCLEYELKACGLHVARQVRIPVRYKDLEFEEGLRLDLLINEKVIIEVKAVEIVNPVWEAQVLSYLRLTGAHLGYLLNFHVPLMKNGIRRYKL